MRFLLIDDQNDLFDVMFYDLKYNSEVEFIPHFDSTNCFFRKMISFYFESKFAKRIANKLQLPFKFMIEKKYNILNYPYDEKEQYFILFLNGCLRTYYSRKVLTNIKKLHPNVSLVLLLYDSHANPNSKYALEKKDLFDIIFTFDPKDAKTYNYEYIYSTLSDIQDILNEDREYSDVFYVGRAVNRLSLMQNTFKRISEHFEKCDFNISGVSDKKEQLYQDIIKYNKYIPYFEVLKMVKSTNCLIEFVMPNQTGITLRTCEAIIFNKKLLTNNVCLTDTPFYNPSFMKIFSDESDIDIEFIKSNIDVNYNYNGCFSPNIIIDKIKSMTF